MEPIVCDEVKYEDLILELGQIWTEECGGDKDEYPGAAASKLMTKQGMKIKDEIKRGDKCIAWEAYWYDGCDTGKAEKFDAIQPLPDCDFPVAETTGECHNEKYDVNCYIAKTVTFKDWECGSRFSGINLSAIKIAEAMKSIRAAVAESVMDTMLTCVQPNMYAKSKGCPNGTMTEFTAADFDSKLLNHMHMIAKKHGCRDYCILDDSNFYEYMLNLMDASCCGDKSAKARIGRYDITHDNFMDDYLGRCSTFLVNPKCFGFINTTRYKNTTPEPVGSADAKTRRWVWKMTDPLMQILEIDSDSGNQSIRNIEYDVEYKVTCCGRRDDNTDQYEHSYFLSYTGGNFKSPITCNKKGPCVFEFTNTGA